MFYPFIGVHPWNINDVSENYLDSMRGILEKHKRCGVGEIGLDRGKDRYDLQVKIFADQLDVAKEYERPVSVHMLRSEADILYNIRKHAKGLKIILHSFTGPSSYIEPFGNAGCYFSISPRILGISGEKSRRLIKAIPEDRILIESDAPMMNHHCNNMFEFIERLSGLMSISAEELIDLTSANAEKVIG